VGGQRRGVDALVLLVPKHFELAHVRFAWLDVLDVVEPPALLVLPAVGSRRSADGEFNGRGGVALTHLERHLYGEVRTPQGVRASLAPAVAVGRDEVDPI